MMNKFFISLGLTFALTSCGGGGDSGGSSGVGGSENRVTFDQIVIPEGFNLRTSSPVMLDISLGSNELMFLNVYGSYSHAKNGEVVADTSSRIIASELKDGQFKGRFTATSGLDSVLIEAWFKDGTRLPFRQVIQLPQETITIRN
ncbi:hypothetical protein ACQKP8_17115 [Photobacterium alginatilyticum]|uniref:hypothetical protein n=1 Tax=Photobacterium alginatilyticum TaxID=1775171 RepID=UPI0040691008